MLHEKLLRLLLLFHIVLQIHADWSDDINEISKSMLDASSYNGWDVTNETSVNKTRVCELGIKNHPSLYTSMATEIENTSINVDLQGDHGKIMLKVKPLRLSGNASSSSIDHSYDTRINVSTFVIYCGQNANNVKYYFGKGLEANSVVVYCKGPNEEKATIAGKFYNLDPSILSP